MTLVGLQFAVVWLGLWLLTLPGFMPAARVVFSTEIIYLVYLSPVWLHRDPLPDRGLGTWRTFFVRTDNLGAAARGFGWLALAGTAAILMLAAIWKPGWTARIDWQAWALRSRSYVISVVIQALVLVGFGLPRLKSLLMPTPRPSQSAATGTPSQRLLVSLVVAILFGSLHAPYLPLVALAAAFGFALAWLSLRTPNVLAVACCQFVLGLQVNLILGLSMRVGAFHDHPDVRFLRDIFSWVARSTGNLR
ncbi:MAG TPA: hypothetical protein VF332_10645 [Vicinamibacterales bacterium]